MKKIIPLLLIGIMVLSGLGAATVTNTSETTMKKLRQSLFQTQKSQKKKDTHS